MIKKQNSVGMLPFGTATIDSDTPFNKVFPIRKELLRISEDDFNDLDAVIIWGGIDIHPSFYKTVAHPKSQVFLDTCPGKRDNLEWHIIRKAHEQRKLIIGVCRGAQMLCAYAGGSLYQDVRGHKGSSHSIVTYDKYTMLAPADHHQMMNLDNTNYEMLAWAEKPLSVGHYERTVIGVSEPGEHLAFGEPEVVYFPEINGLAIQPHPEWASNFPGFSDWVIQITKQKLALVQEHNALNTKSEVENGTVVQN